MILVTGATGITGRALVTRLATIGVPVRAVVRDRARAADLAAAGVELVVADLGTPETLARALRGIRAAYLVTAPDPQQVVWHSNFIRAARRAGVKHIVRHSVRNADPRSPEKIARWHFASQRELEDSGIAWTHLQPVYNMQNFLRFAPLIQSYAAFFAPMKDAALSMVDARDIAAVAAVVLTEPGHEGKTYAITGPEAITFGDAACHLSRVLQTTIRYVDLAIANARRLFLNRGLAAWYVDDLLGFYAFYATGAGAVIADTTMRITGQPGRTFIQFARDYRSILIGAPRAAA